MASVISSFMGENKWLSNFSNHKVTYQGITYRNSEAAFQAQKCINPADRTIFADLVPSEAKTRGQIVKLRPDWEQIKDQIMYEVCLAKFTQNNDIKQLLLNTGDAQLIEGNTWNDDYWGVCTNKGLNKLGKILMRIRTELTE